MVPRAAMTRVTRQRLWWGPSPTDPGEFAGRISQRNQTLARSKSGTTSRPPVIALATPHQRYLRFSATSLANAMSLPLEGSFSGLPVACTKKLRLATTASTSADATRGVKVERR